MGSAEQVTQAVDRAIQRNDLAAVRALYAEDARIQASPALAAPVAPDEALEQIRVFLADPLYRSNWHRIEAIDEHAAVVEGTLRRSRGSHGFTETFTCWLVTVREGLVHRVVAVDDPAAARALYARCGVSAGIDS